MHEFYGTVRAVSYKGNSAVIELDGEVDGCKHAVINDSTKGRIALMNSTTDGTIPVGCRVRGYGRRGPDALLAVEVTQVFPPYVPATFDKPT